MNTVCLCPNCGSQITTVTLQQATTATFTTAGGGPYTVTLFPGAAVTVTYNTEGANVYKQGCNKPPTGWACTRTPGHDGPCAAVPTT